MVDVKGSETGSAQNGSTIKQVITYVLISLLVYLVFIRGLSPGSQRLERSHDTNKSGAGAKQEKSEEDNEGPIVYREFTRVDLEPYNGKDKSRVLMAVKGNVFDVTPGKSFYGPGGPYSNFAGRDASRGLAKNSFEQDMITPIDQPMDTLDDLTGEERDALNGWFQTFSSKYAEVGKLIS